MKTPSLYSLFILTALLCSSASATDDYEWFTDPRPFSERRTKLAEIPVHRYVPQAGTGVVLERRYLLTAGGLLSHVEDRNVPAGVTIPERAYNKLLVFASSWLAYGQLGPRALDNYALVNDLDPIDIAGRTQFEVKVAQGARGNVGHVPNLSTRAYVTPTSPAIGGFVIQDVPRLVLIRAIGPGLAQFGVADPLPSARLRLFTYDTPIAGNDDWNVNPAHGTLITMSSARAGAFPLTPGTRDAAIAMVLAPGTYTVHASGTTLASGSVLLEVYLLD